MKFLIDRSWSAGEIAHNARAFARQRYREHPEVIETCEGLMQAASDTALWTLLKPEERCLLSDSPIIVVPTGEFDVWTATAPSGDGYYIVFDLCIILELLEFFASVPKRGYPAWAACVLSGARRKTTGPRMHLAGWVQDPTSKLIEHLQRNEPQIPYTASMLFGIPFALSFMIGHEYAHHALKHFADGHIVASTATDPAKARPRGSNHAMEFAADAWSMYIISRLPALELSSWLLAIEMMFLYMHLVESFNEACRTIRGLAAPLHSHPSVITRSERISRLGERVFMSELDEAGNLPESLHHNLASRQEMFRSVRKLELYLPYLAECYCGDPHRTIKIHEAVRAGDADIDAYRAEMESIAAAQRSVLKRAGRFIRCLF